MMDDLIQNIIYWACDRNLIHGATPASQYEKLAEEFGELGRALIEDDNEKVKDAIGDMVVVLTILARQRNLSLDGCVESAYNTIKDRKGKMINGKFVKETD